MKGRCHRRHPLFHKKEVLDGLAGIFDLVTKLEGHGTEMKPDHSAWVKAPKNGIFVRDGWHCVLLPARFPFTSMLRRIVKKLFFVQTRKNWRDLDLDVVGDSGRKVRLM